MDKNTLLESITAASKDNIITKDEILNAYDRGQGVKKDTALTRHLNIAEILYYIGGLIVFSGIVILVYQHWSELNTFSRISITLGSAIISYITAVIFTKYEKYEPLSHVFFLISALLSPIGMSIFIYEMKISISFIATQLAISSILLTLYLSSYYIFRKVLFIILNIIFGTWLFFSFTEWVLNGSPAVSMFHLTEYRFLLTGLSYISLGYFFSERDERSLSSPLYSFGVIALLGATFALGGYSPNQNSLWELLFPLVNFAVIYLSVYLKSKSFLTFGTIFLMAYIGKITTEYFANSLGWPLSLVIAGLAIIAIAFISINLNKKYLQKTV